MDILILWSLARLILPGWHLVLLHLNRDQLRVIFLLYLYIHFCKENRVRTIFNSASFLKEQGWDLPLGTHLRRFWYKFIRKMEKKIFKGDIEFRQQRKAATTTIIILWPSVVPTEVIRSSNFPYFQNIETKLSGRECRLYLHFCKKKKNLQFRRRLLRPSANSTNALALIRAQIFL